MLLRIKNSCMKIQPNGRAPPISELMKGCVIHVCSGISRGIWLVRTGWLIGYTKDQHGNSALIKKYLHLYGNQRRHRRTLMVQKCQTWGWNQYTLQTVTNNGITSVMILRKSRNVTPNVATPTYCSYIPPEFIIIKISNSTVNREN